MNKKLNGGTLLECGHQQVVSALRQVIAATGHDQPPVWCVDCNDWSKLFPFPMEIEQDEAPLE